MLLCGKLCLKELCYFRTSLISKFEKNERRPTMEQIIRLEKFYEIPEAELIINWYSEKIAEDLKYTESTSEILKVAEKNKVL